MGAAVARVSNLIRPVAKHNIVYDNKVDKHVLEQLATKDETLVKNLQILDEKINIRAEKSPSNVIPTVEEQKAFLRSIDPDAARKWDLRERLQSANLSKPLTEEEEDLILKKGRLTGMEMEAILEKLPTEITAIGSYTSHTASLFEVPPESLSKLFKFYKPALGKDKVQVIAELKGFNKSARG